MCVRVRCRTFVYNRLTCLDAYDLCHVEAMAACVTGPAVHPSDTPDGHVSAIELFIVTNHKPFNDQVRPPLQPTHPSIQLLRLERCVGLLGSEESASGARDFKRSTCLLISSAPLRQPSPGSKRAREREREGEMHRGRAVVWPQSSGPQVCP